MTVTINSSVNAQGLDDLELHVRRSHEAIGRVSRGLLALAMQAGDGLLEIRQRKLVRHGQWSDLCRRTCSSVRTAQVYVKLAKARALLEANPQTSAHLSIEGALRFLRQHEGTSRTSRGGSLSISIAPWLAAPPAERMRYLKRIGLPGILAALPPEFRTELDRRRSAPAAGRRLSAITGAFKQAMSFAKIDNTAGIINSLNGLRNLLRAEGLDPDGIERIVIEAVKVEKSARRAA